MRSKTAAGEVLEPLSVYDENGIRIDPEPVVEPVAHTSARELARDCVDAVRDVLAERGSGARQRAVADECGNARRAAACGDLLHDLQPHDRAATDALAGLTELVACTSRATVGSE